MNAEKRKYLLAAGAAVVGFFACVIVGASAPRAMTPCRPYTVVPLTGTLIDVRQGDTIVPNEQAILDGVPFQACVSPTNPGAQPSTTITVTDCQFPEFSVNATLVP